MKKIVVRKISITLLSILGLWLLWFLARTIGIESIALAIRKFKLWQIIIISVFPIFTYSLAALRWQIILRGLGLRFKFGQVLQKTFSGAAISTLAPSFDISGQTTKALAIRGGGVGASFAFASVAIDSLARSVANFSFTFLLLGGVLVLGFSSLRALLAFGLVAAGLILYIVIWDILKKGSRVISFLVKVFPVSYQTAEEIGAFDRVLKEFLNRKRGFFLAAFLLSAVGALWEAIQIALVLRFLGLPPQILSIILLYLGMGIPHFLPVPAGIGFVETGAALAGAWAGVGGAIGLTTTLVLRLRDISTLLVGFLLFIKNHFRL